MYVFIQISWVTPQSIWIHCNYPGLLEILAPDRSQEVVIHTRKCSLLIRKKWVSYLLNGHEKLLPQHGKAKLSKICSVKVNSCTLNQLSYYDKLMMIFILVKQVLAL